ncbi:MAG: aldo/keto reductase [Nitrospinota bacterium]|nr:aldo/keto reductase [Nitrospinota bacterium]MDH5677984.1 aldo/keto reductase [Nitrospinota bacterium]MDH5756744.1 aldo/keto reductase [Nitrospinota bacterium]
MEKRKLGQSDLYVSPIGLGAWGIGGPPFWNGRDPKTSVATIQKALDLGVNLIDTAPVYGFGLSEELVGQAVAGRRDEVVIATKCGLRWNGPSLKELYKDLSPGSICQEVEDSLRRLKTDRIDLYQVHWPDQKTPVENFMVALALLKAQGKILNIGVSNFDTAMLQKSMGFAPVVSIQPKYNLLERDIESDLLPFCQERHVGVLAYSPLASGMLTGKYSTDAQWTDWRGKGNMGVFQKEQLGQAVAKVEKLKQVAAQLGAPLASLALRWVTNRPGVTCALAGAYTPEQMEANAAAMEIVISQTDMERLTASAQ